MVTRKEYFMSFIGNLQSVLATILQCIGASIVLIVGFIIKQPYLLIGLVLMLIGVVVSFLKRLIRV